MIIGDLNENNIQTNSKPIENILSKLGFVNLYKNIFITNSFTSVDCVYINFTQEKIDEYSALAIVFTRDCFFSVAFDTNYLNTCEINHNQQHNIIEADSNTLISS